MQKVFQTKIDDCLPACIASLTSIPIEQIPDFSNTQYWWRNAKRWLARRGFKITRSCNNEKLDKRKLYILCVDRRFKKGEYDFCHAVISRGYTVVHDPGRKRIKNRYVMIANLRLEKL